MNRWGFVMVALVACSGPEGPTGPAGPAGPEGPPGANGLNGEAGLSPDAGSSGDSGASGVGETDGTRLKARYTTTMTTGVDGSKQVTKYFAGWWDSQRKEACSPALAGDGKTRCLPGASPTGLYFVDAQCANPVVDVSSAPSCGAASYVPKYASQATVVAGCSQNDLMLVGSKLSPTNWYIKSGNNCSLIGTAPSTLDFYAVTGPVIDPTSFVEMTQTTTTTP